MPQSQDPGDTSAAALAAVVAHGMSQQTLVFQGGMDALSRRLARGLDIRTDTCVTALRERPDGVDIVTHGETIHADRAIVTVPGPLLPSILELRPDEQALADMRYSTGLLACVGINRPAREDELFNAYGTLMGPGLSPLAALSVASRTGHPGAQTDVITCMFTDAESRRLIPQPDSHILDTARDLLATLSSTLKDCWTADTSCHVERIPYAMPTSPPGRVGAIAAYQDAAHDRRVLLGGDVLAWPWSDSAAAAGLWAAQRALDGLEATTPPSA